MDERERLIRDYFDSWLRRDASCLPTVFSEDALYIESHGPRYEGLLQIQQWFTDWLPHGEVLEWRIVRFLHQGNQTAVEWVFRCRYDGEESVFDGVSLIRFTPEGKICYLREFQARCQPIVL